MMKETDRMLRIPDDIMESWQEMTDLLAGILDIPAALIMRVNEPSIEVFVSSNSDGNPYTPGDSEVLFGSGLYCETVINTRERLRIPDALADEKWENNPDIELNMISYLGYPIMLPSNQPFGTLCVLDKRANEYSDAVEKLMQKFRNLIELNLETIFANQVLGDTNKRLSDYLEELQTLRGIVTICSSCKGIKDKDDTWHPVEHYLMKNPQADFTHGICPDCVKKLYPQFSASD